MQRKSRNIIWLPSLLILAVKVAACSPILSDEAEEPTGTPVGFQQVRLTTIVETERSMARSEAFSSPQVAPEVDGRVVTIFHDIGDEVEEGTVLAQLDDSSYVLALSAAQADAAASETRYEQFKRDLNRLEMVGGGQYVSQMDLESARADVFTAQQELKAAQSRREEAQRQVSHTRIQAPISGRIDERYISEGDYVSAGDQAFRMVPDTSARTSLPFPERIGGRLEVGMNVKLRRLGSSDYWIEGQVTRLRPSVEDGMGIVAVVEFIPPSSWPSGTMLEGLVELAHRPNAITVPSESVIARPGRRVVYVLPGREDFGRVEERKVEVGLITADTTEILSGLEPGERVVVDGASYLTNDAEVRRQGAR
ncbi:efflux RND transporter periplasmic adaptor subunit [Alkalimonas collagenimarina]|uniref:Efflux RND transporter periplasmic adaptor subunit n=1 Tax=Alkalimonas collagenimarina TaxID=400390 RepID=A0ABT9GW61_9GAMM|nr:efflux RND transporter periplasmic adaptor subunit [Alkalimonas collagenimarina]MDP4535290.1 efflux RND transporter periplasmic adaptor subunit [Alkalimonas collagenimarina]